MFNFLKFNKGLVSGFTLLELLVSMSIAALIMSVVLFNYGVFNDNLALSAAGQEIAVAIRQAQVYGINVKEYETGSGQFGLAYGIHFDLLDPTNYIIFVDRNGDNKYHNGTGCGGANTDCIESNTLRNGVKISNFCAADGQCADPAYPSIRHMDITFLRPYPDAYIRFADNGGSDWGSFQKSGSLVLKSLKGKPLTLTVEDTGQIYAP